jgi:hypothetical protein
MKVKKKDKKEEVNGCNNVLLYREEREHGTELCELAPCQSLVVLQLHLHLKLLSQSGSFTR